MAPERWLPVVGFERFYEVSDHGQVRAKLRRKRTPAGTILGQHDNGRGYLIVGLYVDGSRKTRTVHSLVLEAFVGPRPRARQTRHLDGDRSNNVLSNLRWGTWHENYHDRLRHEGRVS